MAKLWSFSTTLRSPDRIIDFLKTASELEGCVWNNDNQEKFQILLIKNRKYRPENKNLSVKSIDLLDDIQHELSYEEAASIFYEKDYTEPAMRGRTSFSPLKELGLAYIDNDNKLVISEAAKNIMNNELNFSDFFLKWSMKWQYPNPTSADYVEGYNIKPLIGTLKLIDNVNILWSDLGHEPVGISKNEFGIFALSLTNIDDVKQHAQKVIDYRLKISNLEMRERNNFYKSYIEENLSSFPNATISNIKDYTDNVIRYFSLTNLIKKRGNGYYIDLVPSRVKFIKKLFNVENGDSNHFEDKIKYLNYLCDMSVPQIENDMIEVTEEYRKEIHDLILSNHIYENELVNLSKYSYRSLVELKKKLLFKLDKDNFNNKNGIENIIYNLEHIRNLDIHASLALEKWVATSLITLNDAIEIKPNYSSDDDNNILFTAPAGLPDIECYYNEFDTVCEVTMLTGRDQWHNEGQPVMRHLKDFIEKNDSDKSTYCLFIAPMIHRDTLNTFWYSVKYEFEGEKLKIIPLSLRRFEEILYMLKNINEKGRMFSRNYYRKLFDTICKVDNINNSNDWWTHINESFDTWKKEILQNS